MKTWHTNLLTIIAISAAISMIDCTSETPGPTLLAPAVAAKTDASTVVEDVYELAIGRRCGEIPSRLTTEFRSAIGSTREELAALCDSFTERGKIKSVEVRPAAVHGVIGTVRIALTHRDGRVDEKDERIKLEDGSWLMDS